MGPDFAIASPADALSPETTRRVRTLLPHKRAFDIFNSVVLIVVLSPLMLLSAILVKLQDGGPVFFRQDRLTKGSAGPRVFKILKFRTMVINAEGLGAKITPKGDPRITLVGKILRGTKLDELPQLFNILRGDMSFVGPRPQTLGYVENFRDHYMAIHSLVPAGLTDLATLKYRDEGLVLSRSDDPHRLYVETIMPDKIATHYEYLRNFSLEQDLAILFKTVWHVFVLKPVSKLRKSKEAEHGPAH